MSLIALGLSHRSAPVALLGRVALGSDGLAKLLADLVTSEHIDEALVLASCNRLEIHADVRKFHAGVQEIGETLSRHSGVPLDELTEHLYVHFEDQAVQHLFSVAAGLDSMVVGEAQILGQLRSALALGRDARTVGRVMGPFVERALRVGKRSHSETGIDRAGRSIVSVGIDQVGRAIEARTATTATGTPDWATVRTVVIGAGSMGGLAVSQLVERGVRDLTVVNRTVARARGLAGSVQARSVGMDQLAAVVNHADLVVSCTGSVGVVIDESLVAGRDRPLALLDLALPPDVDARVRTVPDVDVIDLETLQLVLESDVVAEDIDAARRIVTDEVAGYLARRHADQVAPTVVALRERAQQVIDAEVGRLLGRLPEADQRVVHELRRTVERVVDKLLHSPTVKVKELAGSPGGETYAEALRELFSLDAAAAEAVARADVIVDGPAPDGAAVDEGLGR